MCRSLIRKLKNVLHKKIARESNYLRADLFESDRIYSEFLWFYKSFFQNLKFLVLLRLLLRFSLELELTC